MKINPSKCQRYAGAGREAKNEASFIERRLFYLKINQALQ